MLSINETKKQQKVAYEKNKFQVKMNIGMVDDIYSFEKNHLLENRDAAKSFDISVSKYDYVKDFKAQIRGLFGLAEVEEFFLVLYEVSADNDTLDLTQIMTMYDSGDNWL